MHSLEKRLFRKTNSTCPGDWQLSVRRDLTSSTCSLWAENEAELGPGLPAREAEPLVS